jgi:hypothetical protein
VSEGIGGDKVNRINWKFGAIVVLGVAASAGAQGVAPQGSYDLVTPRAAYHLAAMPAVAEGQNSNDPAAKDDLFAGTDVFAKNAAHVTEITMDPDSLGLVGGPDKGKAHTMVLNVVRTYEYDKPGMYNMADVDAFRNKLNSGEWHCSVHVRDLKTGEGQDICTRRRTDGLKESAIISVEPKELTFIHTIRRGEGPGSSELSDLPLMPGLMMGGVPLIAMMDPDAFVNLQMAKMGLRGLPMYLNVRPDIRINPDIRLRMNELKLQGPEMQKQMEEMKNKMKDLKLPQLPEVSPEPQPAPAPPQP